jgi:hypothetical protein
MLLILFIVLVVLLVVRGNPLPQSGYAFSPLDVVVLRLLVLLVAAAFGALGPHSRWF